MWIRVNIYEKFPGNSLIGFLSESRKLFKNVTVRRQTMTMKEEEEDEEEEEKEEDEEKEKEDKEEK